jgi:hypothetical protein
MITYVTKGTGTLFDVKRVQALATVSYLIYRVPACEDKSGEWWGRFALTDVIPELEEYLLEMEDGRWGVCRLKLGKSQPMMGSEVFHHYELVGIGELKQGGPVDGCGD